MQTKTGQGYALRALEEKDGTTAQRFQRGGLLALKAGALRSRNMS